MNWFIAFRCHYFYLIKWLPKPVLWSQNEGKEGEVYFEKPDNFGKYNNNFWRFWLKRRHPAALYYWRLLCFLAPCSKKVSFSKMFNFTILRKKNDLTWYKLLHLIASISSEYFSKEIINLIQLLKHHLFVNYQSYSYNFN